MTDRELFEFLLDVLDNHVEDPRAKNLIEKSCQLLRTRLAQPKKEWLGLTDEEIIDIWAVVSIDYDDEINIVELGKAIDAKLKEKNNE